MGYSLANAINQTTLPVCCKNEDKISYVKDKHIKDTFFTKQLQQIDLSPHLVDKKKEILKDLFRN